MIGIKFDKRLFFNRKKVLDAIGRAKVKVLNRAGGKVRKTARQSIKPRKKGTSSAPGDPPFSHVGTLKRMIYYAYDPERDSVLVGPQALGRSDTPAALEHGGTFRRKVIVRPPRTGRPATKKQKKAFLKGLKEGRIQRKTPIRRRTESVAYEHRPFMEPALEINRKPIADLWKDSVV